MTLHRYAVLTACATGLLLIAGSLVTSTDSGLAVPDWPLSYGMWFPPMIGGIFYEHGHRMIAGLVGLMILGLAGWLWKAEPRRRVRRLGYAALTAVLIQALLGGLTVLLLLPPPVSIAHACLGQAVFCLVVCVAWATSPGWPAHSGRAADAGRPSLRILTLIASSLTALQLLLGAVIRHTGAAVSLHIAGASAMALTTSWLMARLWPRRETLREASRHARRMSLLFIGQVVLGLAVFAHRRAVWLRTAHVTVGALVLTQAVLLAWATSRSILPSVTPTGRRQRLSAYLELTKPRLSGLVLFTTAAGFWLGMRAWSQWGLLLATCLGTALVVGGANALNQWMERDADALMQRTRTRPLPSGRLTPPGAFRFGLAISLAGLMVLGVAVNPLSAAVALAGWVGYLLLYTPLKRRTPLCTLVGAIPGALPPVIGWAGSRQALGAEAWTLFAMLFVWQLPHFLALAVMYRDEFARAGFRFLPMSESDGWSTARQMAGYGLILLPVSLMPSRIGLVGSAYFYGALALGVMFAAVALRAAALRSRLACRRLFLASIVYLPLVLGLLAADRALV